MGCAAVERSNAAGRKSTQLVPIDCKQPAHITRPSRQTNITTAKWELTFISQTTLIVAQSVQVKTCGGLCFSFKFSIWDWNEDDEFEEFGLLNKIINRKDDFSIGKESIENIGPIFRPYFKILIWNKWTPFK